MFYSPSTAGFYNAEIHGDNIPEDAVEITDALYAELIDAPSRGKCIAMAEDGLPMLADPPSPSAETLAIIERAWRDTELAITDARVSRHRDELESSSPCTLSAEEYGELQQYRRQLRDWPQASAFPRHGLRPAQPQWLLEQRHHAGRERFPPHRSL
ncbi:hypothetical protein HDC30_000904 [Pseudomonas sp. JAI115]|uniref:phage tail assembly chaperone n=1 Tax=Pseudomonas sp. JAI115 TaxID=2723061 RepID=UPI00160AF5DE|nr:phage tail assembly chaperone [Pseudomonas sp. JAI115]MBB6153710.1 hypothetical protein [Pseudomonas sp. JAI115]